MLLIDDYKLEYKLGSGSFADVYYTSKKGTNKIYATKRVDKTKALSDKMKNYFLNEVDILKNTHHVNIIKLHEIKNSQKNFYLIMEYCNGGTLEDLFEKYFDTHMKPLPEVDVQHILRQISCGLYYLHKSNIIHRDLKMENILLHFESQEDKEKMNVLKAQCKIIDFGFAKYLNDKTVQSSICGSPICMDPVILKALVYKQIDQNFSYTDKADIWSLGIMFYTLLIGKPPFVANNYHDLYNKINEGNYHIPKTLKLSKQAISLINGMLQYDCKERLSMEQLIYHEFLTMDVKNFEYCDLNYIDKGESNITLNNKEDVKKIWDNYQVADNNKVNLSEIKGKLSGKSIINDMDQNNCYDANKNFQAFYIDDKNNIIFTNGTSEKPVNEAQENQNYQTKESNNILTQIHGNNNFQNEANKAQTNDMLKNNLTPSNTNFNDSLIDKNHLQNQISERLKKYEDRGKEFKKITEMLYGELGNKQTSDNITPAANKNVVDLTSKGHYESPSTLATTAHNLNTNLTSGQNYYRQNTHYNPSVSSNLVSAAIARVNNVLENKVTTSFSDNKQEITKTEHKAHYTTQTSNNEKFESAPSSTFSPAYNSKPSSGNYYTNVSEVLNNSIKLLSESLYNRKPQGLNSNTDVKYYSTETDMQREKKILSSENNNLNKNVIQDKSPIHNVKPAPANAIDYTKSIYLGDMTQNSFNANAQLNQSNSLYGNYYTNSLTNSNLEKVYHTTQSQTNFNLEKKNTTVNLAKDFTNSTFGGSYYSKEIKEKVTIDNRTQEKNPVNLINNHNTTNQEFKKVDLIRDNYKQYNTNTNEDTNTAYEIVSSGNSNKYNQESYSKSIISNNNNNKNNANSNFYGNTDTYNPIRIDKGLPFSTSNASIYLREDEAMKLGNLDFKATKPEQKIHLSQSSLNLVLEMKKFIEKSVDSFNIENNNAKNNQNQFPLQSKLIKIFEDLKSKMNEATYLIEKEGK